MLDVEYIELVIKIPKLIYENCKKECEENDAFILDHYVYAIGTGTPNTNKMRLISKIRDCAKNYPQDYSDKVYDAVTIYEGIEEVHSCGVRNGLERAISIIEADSIESEEKDDT